MTSLWLVVGMAGRPHGQQTVAGPWFEDVTAVVGLDVMHRNGATGAFRIEEIIGAGVGLIDYDNDSDLDVLVIQGAAPDVRAGGAPASGREPRARLFRNDLQIRATGHAWLGLDLRQPGPNRCAIGATVVVDTGDAAGRLFRVRTDRSYLSASDPRVLIGLRDHRGPVGVTITWPDGTRQKLTVTPRRYVRIDKA